MDTVVDRDYLGYSLTHTGYSSAACIENDILKVSVYHTNMRSRENRSKPVILMQFDPIQLITSADNETLTEKRVKTPFIMYYPGVEVDMTLKDSVTGKRYKEKRSINVVGADIRKSPYTARFENGFLDLYTKRAKMLTPKEAYLEFGYRLIEMLKTEKLFSDEHVLFGSTTNPEKISKANKVASKEYQDMKILSRRNYIMLPDVSSTIESLGLVNGNGQ